MKPNKKVIMATIIIVAIGILSLINTKITNITGKVTFDLTGEYPGIGLFLILIMGAIGTFVVIKHHNKH